MCDQCRDPRPFSLTPGPRLKLWEIPARFHCSIIGTCLPMATLRRLLPRAGLRAAPDADDYSLHSHAVAGATTPSALTKLIGKALDAAWAGDLRRLGARPPEALGEPWAEAVASGRIAGAYWALLSRRGVPGELLTEAYGTVHMLSHLLGGEARAGLRKLTEAERRHADMEASLAQLRSAKAAGERERDARIAELEARLRAARATAAAASRPAPAEAPSRDLAARLDEAERRLRVERRRARAAEAELQRLNGVLDAPVLARAADAVAGACPGDRPAAPDAEPAQPVALEGKCILYVGGRPGAIPRLRTLVERRNGRLLHHDGGIEQTVRLLDGLVEQADLVVCPIDCVSHEACLRAKRLCRRLDKPFLPLRTAALFARGIEAGRS